MLLAALKDAFVFWLFSLFQMGFDESDTKKFGYQKKTWNKVL